MSKNRFVLLLLSLTILAISNLYISNVFAAVPAVTSGFTAVLQEDFETKPDNSSYVAGDTLVSRAGMTYSTSFSTIQNETTTANNNYVNGAGYRPTAASITLTNQVSGKVNLWFRGKSTALTGNNSILVALYNGSTPTPIQVDFDTNGLRLYSSPWKLGYSTTSTNILYGAATSNIWHTFKYEIDTTAATNNIKVYIDNYTTPVYTGTSSALINSNLKTIQMSYAIAIDDILVEQLLPSATTPTIDGTLEVGKTLTGNFQYSYGTITQEDQYTTFKWYRADSSNGTYTEIANATQKTYTLTDADASKYIKFEVTPKAVNGTIVGTTVQSESVGSILALPKVSNVVLSGATRVGNTVKANYAYSDANGDVEAGSSYRWLRADAEAGPYVEIAGATGNTTATLGSEYIIRAEDDQKYIKFEITPKNAIESGATVNSNAIAIKEMPPVASLVAISGNAFVGSTLTGSYSYSDPNLDLEQGSTYRWLRGDSASGPFDVVLGEGSISATTTVQYLVTSDDTNKYIVFEVTPKSNAADVATKNGQPTPSSPTSAVGAPPVAQSVSISGLTSLNDVLTGHYTFYDVNGDAQGVSTYRWLVSDTQNGTYTPIQGATSSTYTITELESNKWIKFEVTPISVNQPTTGQPVDASSINIHTIINFAIDDNFESYKVGETPTGWSAAAKIAQTTSDAINSTKYLVGASTSAGSAGVPSAVYSFAPLSGIVVMDCKFKGYTNTAYSTVFNFFSNTSSANLFSLDNRGTGYFTYNYSTGVTDTFVAGTWYNLKVVMDTSTAVDNVKIYFNNVLRETFSNTKLLNANVNQIQLGFLASIDDLKIYSPVAPKVSNVAISGTAKTGETLTATYDYHYYKTTTDSGSAFKWYSSDSATGTYTEIAGATGKTYVLTPNEAGKYIKVEVTPKYGNASGTAVISGVSGPVQGAPVVSNITITGSPRIGNTVKANYTYFDANGDVEALSEYRWLRSDSMNGPYVTVVANGTTTSAQGAEYIIKAEDADKFIKVEITPKSNVAPTTGIPVLSDATVSLLPLAPYATNVAITGTLVVGEVLTGSYQYYDPNIDDESLSTYRWLSSDSATGTFVELAHGTTTAGQGATYTLTRADVNRYIRFEITPISVNLPTIGEVVQSSSTTMILAKPEVTNVSISGTASINSTVRGLYDYYDLNGEGQGQSTFRWLIDNGSGQYTPINEASGRSYTITSEDMGKSIVFEVTPISVAYPYSGVTVRSAPIIVSKSTSTISVSGGGGGGSYPPVIPIPNTNSTFKDIDGHWAKADIEYLYSKNIITGSSQDTFSPDANITRAEFAALVSRALGLNSDKYKDTFSDVSNSEWYANVIQAVYDSGIVSGSNDGFRPLEPINREEMVKIIVKAYKTKKGDAISGTEKTFVDGNDISEWAMEYVKDASMLNIVNGMDDGSFAPKNYTTRAQAATIIKRLLGLI